MSNHFNPTIIYHSYVQVWEPCANCFKWHMLAPQIPFATVCYSWAKSVMREMTQKPGFHVALREDAWMTIGWYFSSTWRCPFCGVTLWVYIYNYGKSPFSIGKSTISMAMFNSYVSHNQRVPLASSMDDMFVLKPVTRRSAVLRNPHFGEEWLVTCWPEPLKGCHVSILLGDLMILQIIWVNYNTVFH